MKDRTITMPGKPSENKGMTDIQAQKIIERYKDETAFYGNNNTDLITGENIITYDSMYNMLRDRFEMGRAETMCIIAALVLSGAQFDGELTRND